MTVYGPLTPIPAVGTNNPAGQDREYESNPRFLALPEFGIDYGPQELALAFAIADTGAAGGGTSAPVIATGIDTSVSVPAILSDTTAILTSIGDATSVAGDLDVIGQLLAIEDALSGTGGATGFTEYAGTATVVSAIASPANASNLEITIQNKSQSQILKIRLGSAPDATNGYCIPPLNALTFNGILAQQSLHVLRDLSATADVPYYGVSTQG